MDTTNERPAPPRLYRSTRDRAIAGVCAGLAQYFNIDVAIVRLAFLAFALAGGASVLLYVVLWIAVPADQGVVPPTAVSPRSSEALAAILIAIGSLWLLSNFGVFSIVQWRYAWPLAFIALGVVLLARRFAR